MSDSTAINAELPSETSATPLAVQLTRAGYLWRRSMRRQFLSRQTIVAVILFILCALIVLAWSLSRNVSPRRFAEVMLIPSYIAFLMPILAVCYGASSVGSEREDGTLVYLLIVSVPRPLIYTMKFLAGQCLAGGMALAALGALCLVAGEHGREMWPVFWPASLLGVMAYTSLFMLLGAVFRHGTVLALVYWFFLEVMMGNLPGMINRVSLSFFVKSLIYAAGREHRIQPLGDAMNVQFEPVAGPTAAVVLLTLISVLYLAGAAIFSRKEYRDLS